MPSPPERASAIYARYSSHNQDRGCSIEVQLEACRKLAGEGATTYIDRAVTGTTMDRQAFNRMMVDAAGGHIDTLYVYRFDRFGRDAEAHRFVKMLEASGVRVVSATEGDDPLTRGIHLVVAEDFSRRHGQRVSDAKLRRFREGRYHGGPVPFGYQVVEGRLVVEPTEAELVRKLFKRYVRDVVGHKQLAKWLTDQGVKPRRSERWSAGSVRRMLQNRLYLGDRAYRQYRDVAKPARLRQEDPEFEHDSSLQIVDEATFHLAQELLEGRRRHGMTHRARRFSKLIYCAHCDSTFVRRYPSERPDYVQWGCGLRIRHGRELCRNSRHVREYDLVERVQASIDHVLGHRDRIIGRAIARAEAKVGETRQALQAAEREATRLEGELEQLAARLADPDLQRPAVKSLISQQIDQKSVALDELMERRRTLSRSGGAASEIERVVTDLLDTARHSLAEAVSDSQYNAFVRQWFGELTSDAHGRLRPRAPQAWS